jgi:hypothetical protein
MASSLALVHTVYGLPVSTGVVDVTLPVSWRLCFSRLDDDRYHNIDHTPVHQSRLKYYRHCGLRAYRGIRLAFVP